MNRFEKIMNYGLFFHVMARHIYINGGVMILHYVYLYKKTSHFKRKMYVSCYSDLQNYLNRFQCKIMLNWRQQLLLNETFLDFERFCYM